jgi:hypothetical protein
VVARGFNLILIALVLGALAFGAFLLGRGIAKVGNEGAAASSGTPQPVTQPAMNTSQHSRRRFELVAGGAGGAIVVFIAALAGIDASRRRRVRRAAHWHL